MTWKSKNSTSAHIMRVFVLLGLLLVLQQLVLLDAQQTTPECDSIVEISLQLKWLRQPQFAGYIDACTCCALCLLAV
jgi:hypothetical protein